MQSNFLSNFSATFLISPLINSILFCNLFFQYLILHIHLLFYLIRLNKFFSPWEFFAITIGKGATPANITKPQNFSSLI